MSASSTRPFKTEPRSRSISGGVTLNRSEKNRAGAMRTSSVIHSLPGDRSGPNRSLSSSSSPTFSYLDVKSRNAARIVQQESIRRNAYSTGSEKTVPLAANHDLERRNVELGMRRGWAERDGRGVICSGDVELGVDRGWAERDGRGVMCSGDVELGVDRGWAERDGRGVMCSGDVELGVDR